MLAKGFFFPRKLASSHLNFIFSDVYHIYIFFNFSLSKEEASFYLLNRYMSRQRMCTYTHSHVCKYKHSHIRKYTLSSLSESVLELQEILGKRLPRARSTILSGRTVGLGANEFVLHHQLARS